MPRLKLAVLASGRGSNLQAILDGAKAGKVNAEVVVVLSDKQGASVLKRAAGENIPALWIDPKSFLEKKDYEAELLKQVKEYRADYIILAGYMRILSKFFIRNAGIPILNIHPSLLPSFQGLDAQKQAVDYGVRFSGCTVHFVDEGVDTGPIILQAVVPVYPEDTVEALSLRILEQEHEVYPRAIQLLSEGRVICRGRKVILSD
ncbi:MAG: phosphoribosylglycinamide formyltransferase [Clostridia bacterium]|jgi:phosphoribosylglycinamide formyltransferase-1|nr:phosphoribosylglycinamide formyltransferase [Clostridia bacterium]